MLYKQEIGLWTQSKIGEKIMLWKGNTMIIQSHKRKYNKENSESKKISGKEKPRKKKVLMKLKNFISKWGKGYVIFEQFDAEVCSYLAFHC